MHDDLHELHPIQDNFILKHLHRNRTSARSRTQGSQMMRFSALLAAVVLHLVTDAEECAADPTCLCLFICPKHSCLSAHQTCKRSL